MNYKEMSREELQAELTAIQMELDSRFEAEKREAIRNFEKAFKELQKYVEIYTSDEYFISSFDEFQFE